MKKFTLALALALCIGSLSACGGSSTPASSAAASNGSAPEKTAEPIVITFTHATWLLRNMSKPTPTEK